MRKKIVNMILIIIVIISINTASFCGLMDTWTVGSKTGDNIQQVRYDNDSGKVENDDTINSNARYALKMNGYNGSDSFTLPEPGQNGENGHVQLQYTETMIIRITVAGYTTRYIIWI